MDDDTDTPARVYVGSATAAADEPLHHFHLRRAPSRGDSSPALWPRDSVAGIAHPTYLANHPRLDIVYAVSETSPGELVVLQADANTGDLREVQRVSSSGDGPCHLSTDGRHLFTAHYVSGTTSVHALDGFGRIERHIWSSAPMGQGPHPRQEAPHAHCVVPDPDGQAFWYVDLGTDTVTRRPLTGLDGDTPASNSATVPLPPGAGPRHIAFHPVRREPVVVCELDNTVVALPHAGRAAATSQTLSTLPADASEPSLAAAVRFDPTGRHVYVSNRGHDSIAMYAYGTGDAPLTLIGHVPCGGAGPRDVIIDGSGELMLVANQHSGEISGFMLDPPDLPRPLGVLARVPHPTCILIVPPS